MNRALRSMLVAGVAMAALGWVLYPTAAQSAANDPPPAAARHRPATHIAVRQPFPGHASDALQVVSVVAASTHSTTATLTRWQRAAVGASWHRVGRPHVVHVGSAGLTAHDSEGSGKTPIGSFTLSRAFGREPNAGQAVTRMHYRQLQVGDGWSSQAGRVYNTFERNTGELYAGRDTWAHYAILIDYNVRRIRQGAGSGFFLHVGSSSPTAGCVGAPLATVRGLLQWLDPRARPRIVISTRR